jgi:3-methyl-2-oxobutanoate hydroxymethyltransferase
MYYPGGIEITEENKMHKGLSFIYEKKAKGEKLARTICYDYPMACIAEAADIDVINVGDSFQNVILGLPDTLGCKLDIMIEHARAVRRGAPSCYTLGDMPFGTYQISETEAVKNCCKYMAEGDVD